MKAQIENKPEEVAEFIVKEMLERKVEVETIIGGLQKAGVENPVIKKAFDKHYMVSKN